MVSSGTAELLSGERPSGEEASGAGLSCEKAPGEEASGEGSSGEAGSWLRLEVTSCLLCSVVGVFDSEEGGIVEVSMVGGRSALGSIVGDSTEGAGSGELLVVGGPV